MNKHFTPGSNFPWSSVSLRVLICFITLTKVIRPLTGHLKTHVVPTLYVPHACRTVTEITVALRKPLQISTRAAARTWCERPYVVYIKYKDHMIFQRTLRLLL